MPPYIPYVLVPLDDKKVVEVGGQRFLMVSVDDFEDALAAAPARGRIRKNHKTSETILEIVRSEPGLSRREIDEALKKRGVQLTESALGHILSNLRRTNHIENRGSRKEPQYHINQ